MSENKAGAETSEFKATQVGGMLSIAATVCGLITAYLPTVVDGLPQDGQAYLWGGIILAAVGVIGKVLTALGYNAGRVRVKEAAELTKAEDVKAQAITAHGGMQRNVSQLTASVSVLANEFKKLKADSGASKDNDGAAAG